MPYENYVQTYLFAPAGMERSFYCREDSVVTHRAHGYDTNREGRLVQADYLDQTWPYAAGSLCSTVADLIAWNRALHREGKILSPAMYQKLITPVTLNDGTPLRYAQGIINTDIDGHHVLVHGGGIPGFLSDLRYYPEEDLTVVTLVNTTGPVSPANISAAIARSLLGEKAPTAVPFTGNLHAYAGTYKGRSRGQNMEVVVRITDNQLLVSLNGQEQPPMQYAGNDTWRYHQPGGVDMFLQFRKQGGRYEELRLDLGYGYYLLKRTKE